MSIDLNIDNYNLDDILNLFRIPKDFTEEDLKNAKKVVLQTHPDKSKLPPDYFRFYSKAYKVLFNMWEFKNKSTKVNANTEYDTSSSIEKSEKQIMDNFLSKTAKDPKDFNKWFNEQFEKNKIQREDEQTGYGDWLRSDEDIDEERKISHTQLGEEIEKKKRQARALVVHNGVNELYANYSGASDLLGTPGSYSSDLFSSLQYEDLKKAHTESVVPVTMEDYNNVKKFNNVNEYNSYRGSQDVTPLSEIQAREYLMNKSKLQEQQTTERAYKLAREVEESTKKHKEMLGSMMKLTNF